ncbi:hypothetical protein F4861DRAFT_551939 [Xylaria intraflava]|nr:hypothetical protein F4861DRAFT_551939 [Xylaria intraflava]
MASSLQHGSYARGDGSGGRFAGARMGASAGDSGRVSACNSAGGANIGQDGQDGQNSQDSIDGPADPAAPTALTAPTAPTALAAPTGPTGPTALGTALTTASSSGPGSLNYSALATAPESAPESASVAVAALIPPAPVRPPPVPPVPQAQASRSSPPLLPLPLPSFSPPAFDFNFNASPSAPLPKHNILHAHRQSHSSSKLPTFRFTDLKESITLPSLLQHRHHRQQQEEEEEQQPRHYIGSDQPSETQPTTLNQSISSQPVPESKTTHNFKIVLPDPQSEKSNPARSRAATSHIPSASLPATLSSVPVGRSTSLDAPTNALPNPASVTLAAKPAETVVTVLKRRAPPTSAAGGLPAGRDLLLPKGLKQKAAPNEKRASVSRKPPVSYKPPASANGSNTTTAHIPPIRSFRSSGERRSLVLDMNLKSARNHDTGDENSEGRRGDDAMQWTTNSAKDRPDGDDSGDLFLRIAREDSSQRQTANGRTYADNPNVISRVARSARRPLSLAVSSYQSPSYRSPSPPNLSRRLSEQESSRARGPPVSYRGHSREAQSDEFKFRGASTPLKASPLTQRTFTFQVPSDSAAIQRRRQLSVDQAPASASRLPSALKQPNVNYSHPRVYNSSPLVANAADAPKQDAQPTEPAPADGTDSTISTGAPSTVWDELEELKSRIHRLELTGKLPPTSNAAITGTSDERPPTAHTNATTLSASPKRGATSIVQSIEASTLAKSKDFLAPEVYDALEAATVDALALAGMMGTAGQPGPISSGASNIGSGTGTVTDRQLRKKADSICRSLTELCLALSENALPAKTQQVATPLSEDDTVTDPTITPFTVMASQRRPSAPANRVEFATSPRTAPRNEEKRVSILTASPRYNSNNNNAAASADATPTTPGRKSSLLFSRSRRAGTEEPEDGRRASVLSRSRRAGTEEPEDHSARKPVVTRGRRGTIEDSNEDEFRFRMPSRAITEVNGFRSREYSTHVPSAPVLQETDRLASSALPRRRLAGVASSTRLAQPATLTTAASVAVTPNRRYTDRITPSRETAPEPAAKTAEDRPQRQFSLARTGSLTRRVTNRPSMIATPSRMTTSYHR